MSAAFPSGLLVEARARAQTAAERIDQVMFTEVASRAADARAELASIIERLDEMLADPTLGQEAQGTSHLLRFRRIAYDLRMLEGTRLAFLLHYTDPDRRLTALTKQLASEIGWSEEDPIVATGSRQGYTTSPNYVLISVPAAEDRRLLAVPDLCHELAHTLYVRYIGKLIGPLLDELLAYVQRDSQLPATAGRYISLWRNWIKELTCDLIAAYVAGPAYLSQHVCLASLGSGGIWGPAATHPADGARYEVILEGLRGQGHGPEQTAQAEAHWRNLVELEPQKRPKTYRSWYPRDLLDPLLERVPAACRELGLVAYSDAPADAIVRLADEGWAQHIADPEAYLEWERKQLCALWERLEVPAG